MTAARSRLCTPPPQQCWNKIVAVPWSGSATEMSLRCISTSPAWSIINLRRAPESAWVQTGLLVPVQPQPCQAEAGLCRALGLSLPSRAVACRGLTGSPKPCWTHAVGACRTQISEEHLVVTSRRLCEDLPGSSTAGQEPELAQHLADPLRSQLGAPVPCPPALPRHRGWFSQDAAWVDGAHKSDSEQTQVRVFAFNILQSPGVCSPTFSRLGSTREAFPTHRPKQLPSTQGRGAAKVVQRMSRCLSGKWGQREEMWFPVLVPAQLRKGQSSAGAVLLLQSLCSHHVLKGESSLDGCSRLSSSRASQFS